MSIRCLEVKPSRRKLSLQAAETGRPRSPQYRFRPAAQSSCNAPGAPPVCARSDVRFGHLRVHARCHRMEDARGLESVAESPTAALGDSARGEVSQRGAL